MAAAAISIMPPSDTIDPQLQELAQQLVTWEGSSESPPDDTMPEFRVLEKFRLLLTTLIGEAGFRSLLARALTLAKTQEPALKNLQVMSNGEVEGLESHHSDHAGRSVCKTTAAANVYLIAQLLDLLATFIGKGLTLNLVLGAWPDLPAARTKSPQKERP